MNFGRIFPLFLIVFDFSFCCDFNFRRLRVRLAEKRRIQKDAFIAGHFGSSTSIAKDTSFAKLVAVIGLRFDYLSTRTRARDKSYNNLNPRF